MNDYIIEILNNAVKFWSWLSTQSDLPTERRHYVEMQLANKAEELATAIKENKEAEMKREQQAKEELEATKWREYLDLKQEQYRYETELLPLTNL